VWAALEEGGTDALAERIATQVGMAPDALAPEVDAVVAQFRDSLLLEIVTDP
jgi:hypothetical protein